MNAQYGQQQAMEGSSMPDYDALTGQLMATIPVALGICIAIALVFWLVATVTKRREEKAYLVEVSKVNKETNGTLSDEQLHGRATESFFSGKNRSPQLKLNGIRNDG